MLLVLPAIGLSHAQTRAEAIATPDGAAATAPMQVVAVQGTAASYDARRYDTAGKIVVDREELQKFGDATVADVLKRQPGIAVDGNGAISMRGLANGYTQILLNGEKVAPGFSIDSLSPDLIEKIEILRSATAEHRTDSIAGTINIILKKAARRSQNTAKASLANARGRWTPGVSLEISERGEALSYSLLGALNRRDFLVTTREQTTGLNAAAQPDLARVSGMRMTGRTDTISLTPNAELKMRGGDSLSLQTFLSRTQTDKDLGGNSLTTLGDPLDYASNRQLTDERVTQLRADLAWTHKIASGSTLELKLKAESNKRDTDFNQRGFSDTGRLDLEDHTLSHAHGRSLQSSGKYTNRLFGKHALVMGWDGEAARRNEDRLQTLSALNGADGGYSALDFDATIRRLGVYLQDEWTPSERLSVYLGIRSERINMETRGNLFDTIGHREHMLSPLMQLLWKLPDTEEDQIRAGLSRTYRPPELAALVPRPYTSTNNSQTDPDTRGNPALRPERALGLDLAYERNWKSGAMLSVGGYLRKIDAHMRDEVVLEGARWVSYPVNGGRATIRGVELDGKFPLRSLLPRAPKVDIRFNLTRNWSRVDDLPGPDNRVGDQLRLTSTLGADYQASQRWTLGAAYTFKTGGAVRSGPHLVDITGYRRELDMYAVRQLGPRAKLRMTLSNALHQDLLNGTRYFDAQQQRQVLQYRVTPVVLRAALEWTY
ncbi:MAG TPA: TonB-dependent receptor [Duganella sp.]|nr:TonB-dependent receptor [Duganella sp.]